MNTWKVILATLVIFGAGVITGGLLVTYSDSVLRHPRREGTRRNAASPPMTAPPRDNRPPIPQNFLMRTNLLERLDRELQLDTAQRERIEKIIHAGQERIRELSQRIQPQVRAELAETRQRISAELSSEQQLLFEDLIRRRPNASRPATNPPAALTFTNPQPSNR